jgi:hypothetical protein
MLSFCMTDPPCHCVFFDTNLGTQEGGYPLVFEQSKRDLEAMGDALKEGAEILLRMPGELEFRARLRWRASPFGPVEECWWADIIPGTVRYLDGST